MVASRISQLSGKLARVRNIGMKAPLEDEGYE